MANTVGLEIITPSKSFFRGEVEMVIVNTLEGEEGFLPQHAWACKLLGVGELWIKEPGATGFRSAAVAGGFIDVKDSIVIYTDTAEWKEDIDMERAEKAKAEAEAWLNSAPLADREPDNIARAEVALAKAISRIKVAQGSYRN